jgi:glyoxylase-like metal-dependent hydrolase (beta-lactamase superfamily II)
MRVHHLNCATDCPLGGPIFDGRSTGPLGEIVGHCLLIETEAHGLVLVDTGYGLKDVAHPHRSPARIPRFFRGLLNIRLREEETAARQIERLGFRREDVRHIVLTHLDFDHAGGIEDFPAAAVHVMQAEYDAATRPHAGYIPNARYRRPQWNEVEDWRLYGAGGAQWFGFDAVRDLDGLPPEILLVPLPGHTWGHAGVAVRQDDGKWLLQAGDAYFHRGEVRSPTRRCTPGLRAYQTMMETHREQRLANQARVRRLSVDHAGEVRVVCSHDPVEFERCVAGRPL